MFHATAARLRAAESFRQRLMAALLAGLAAACAFAAIAASFYATPPARTLALGIYSLFGTGAGLACAAIRQLLSAPTAGLRLVANPRSESMKPTAAPCSLENAQSALPAAIDPARATVTAYVPATLDLPRQPTFSAGALTRVVEAESDAATAELA